MNDRLIWKGLFRKTLYPDEADMLTRPIRVPAFNTWSGRENARLGFQTKFRSFANIIKKSIDSSEENDKLLKSCLQVSKMSFLLLAFLEIINNFVVPLGLKTPSGTILIH